MLTPDNLKEAFIGIGSRCGQPDIAVYSIPKCIEILMRDDGCTYEEALDHMQVNCIESWVGAETPMWVQPMNQDEAETRIAECD